MLSEAFVLRELFNFIYWWSLIISKNGEPPNWLLHTILDYKPQQSHTQMQTKDKDKHFDILHLLVFIYNA